MGHDLALEAAASTVCGLDPVAPWSCHLCPRLPSPSTLDAEAASGGLSPVLTSRRVEGQS